MAMMIFWEVDTAAAARRSQSSRVHSLPSTHGTRCILPSPLTNSHRSNKENQSVAPGGTITGAPSYQSTYQAHAEDEEEPEVIKQWRERRDLALQDRSEKSAAKQDETVKAAQQNIDDFYENYNSKKEKSIAATRREAESFLENRVDTSAGGTSWERIAKLVDLSGKGVKGGASGTGKEKFREILLSLRKDENAPGATGV
jgi:hypothetical protein